MKHVNRLLAILLLLILPTGFTPHKTLAFKSSQIIQAKQVCLMTIEQPDTIFEVQVDTCIEESIDSTYFYAARDMFKYYVVDKLDELNSSMERYEKWQRYNKDTCGILVPLRDEIDSLDLYALLKFEDRDSAIRVVLEYFPKVDTTKRGNIRNLAGLLAITRMDVVWEYLELKYKIPREISISFWIHETGWGKSSLFKKHNNFGGIKYHKSLRIPYETYAVYYEDDCDDPDTEVVEKCPFIGYRKLSVAINSWGRVLGLTRYTKDYDVRDDYKTMVAAYHNNGYWTSRSGYVNRVATIERYDLQKI